MLYATLVQASPRYGQSLTASVTERLLLTISLICYECLNDSEWHKTVIDHSTINANRAENKQWRIR